ncbi:hypothetical protein F4V57_04920 [Acinetobacter qingfengensis]|nr:hypothetical protein F4V57_04920 [Acinetobacter qingfengensis]
MLLKQDASRFDAYEYLISGNLNTRKSPTWVKCEVKSSCGTHKYSPDQGLFYPFRNGNERRLC